jgi:hypothetical protein
MYFPTYKREYASLLQSKQKRLFFPIQPKDDEFCAFLVVGQTGLP